MMYKTCPRCGANIDPGERCECLNEPAKRAARKEAPAYPRERCPECPNLHDLTSQSCPLRPGYPDAPTCIFVAAYIAPDKSVFYVGATPGWQQAGRTLRWSMFYRPPRGAARHIQCRTAHVRSLFDDAQADLNAYAQKCGWRTSPKARPIRAINQQDAADAYARAASEA